MQIRGKTGILEKTEEDRNLKKRKTVKAFNWVTPWCPSVILSGINVLHIDTPDPLTLCRGAEQRQIWQIVLYCDRIRCYAAEMWQKLKCYACFILPKLIKNRLTDQWYWSRIGKVAAYLVKQQNSLKRIARKT